MKDRVFYAILVLLVILAAIATLLTAHPASAANVTVCRDGNQFLFMGIDWTADVSPWYVADGASIEDGVLRADPNLDGEYAGQVVVGVWTGEDYSLIIGDMNTAPCDSGWQPSAPSILIEAPGPGPYLLEIRDAYGNWSLVTDSANPDGIMLYNHAGHVELIGSMGQSTNPDHYRLVTR